MTPVHSSFTFLVYKMGVIIIIKVPPMWDSETLGVLPHT